MTNLKNTNSPQFYQFTLTDILNQITNWKLEPLSQEEQSALQEHFTSQDTETFSFKENDIESFILETLTDLELED
jgi:hypothetical protein